MRYIGLRQSGQIETVGPQLVGPWTDVTFVTSITTSSDSLAVQVENNSFSGKLALCKGISSAI